MKLDTKFVGVGLAIGVWLLWLLVSTVSAQVSPVPTQTPPTAEASAGTFGRVVEETGLASNPRGVEFATLEAGWEVVITDMQESQGQVWLEVEVIADHQTGWVRTEAIEFALPGSTAFRRSYPDGWCSATPVEVSRMEGVGLFDRYQHAMRFDSEVPVADIDDFSLLFNAQPRDLNLRLDITQNAYLLPATWVIRHSGPLPPFYDQEGYWQLIYECGEVLD